MNGILGKLTKIFWLQKRSNHYLLIFVRNLHPFFQVDFPDLAAYRLEFGEREPDPEEVSHAGS